MTAPSIALPITVTRPTITGIDNPDKCAPVAALVLVAAPAALVRLLMPAPAALVPLERSEVATV
jgi:hypothetical protein